MTKPVPILPHSAIVPQSSLNPIILQNREISQTGGLQTVGSPTAAVQKNESQLPSTSSATITMTTTTTSVTTMKNQEKPKEEKINPKPTSEPVSLKKTINIHVVPLMTTKKLHDDIKIYTVETNKEDIYYECYCGEPLGEDRPNSICGKDCQQLGKLWWSKTCYNSKCTSHDECGHAHETDAIGCVFCHFTDHVLDFCAANVPRKEAKCVHCKTVGHTSRYYGPAKNGPNLCDHSDQYDIIENQTTGSRYWVPKEARNEANT